MEIPDEAEVDCGDQRSGMTPKWGFGSNASSGRIVLLPGTFSAHGASKMATLGAALLVWIYSVSELRRACFRQARVAQAVLPPGALFQASASAFPLCAPKSHMCPLPHLASSESN